MGAINFGELKKPSLIYQCYLSLKRWSLLVPMYYLCSAYKVQGAAGTDGCEVECAIKMHCSW